MKYSYVVKIPKDRIAVFLGVKGSNKKNIEEKLGIKINVDSKEGDVTLEGEDSLALVSAQNIVKAIGRGFNPEIAFDLLNDENYFDTISMEEYSKDSKKDLARLKARAIGEGGKARRTIEDLTNTNVSVYGKTISIIGDYEGVGLARKAFESLLNGSRHSTVYAFLEKHRKQIKYKL